jgi:SAM-dependent methyltransferase
VPEARDEVRRRGHRWHAAIYDPFMRLNGDSLDELRRFAAGDATGRVLEIGCGTGLNLDFYNWDRVEHLDACDPDPYMLERARRRLERLPADVRERVSLHDAPAEALAFEDATFDSAVSTLVLCTVDNPLLACREVSRTLRPGGRLRLVEHIRGNGTRATFQRLIQPVWGWTAGGCHLDRDTELTIAAAGLRLRVLQRFSMGPLLPAICAIATRPHAEV